MSRAEAECVDVFASVIVILDENESVIASFLRGMSEQLEGRYSDYEILVIAQGAQPLRDEIQRALAELPRLRVLALARRVDQRVALSAGLENAIGDYVLLIDPLLDSPAVGLRALELGRAGNDIVIGCAKQPKTWTCALGKPILDGLLARVIQYRPPPNQTLLRCLSRATVNAVTASSRFHHQLYLRVLETGYPICTMDYELTAAGREAARVTLRGEIRRAISLAVFSSTVPLRLMSAAGFFGSFLAFGIGLYSFAIRLFKDAVIEGWTTMVAFMSVLFMLLFSILAFFGEYLGRLLDDHPGQQHYNVAFERTSKVMVDERRLNVLEHSADASPPSSRGAAEHE